MPLTVSRAANLKKVYSYLDKDKDPVKQTMFAFGALPRRKVRGAHLPDQRCSFGTGIPRELPRNWASVPVPKYRATLSLLQATRDKHGLLPDHWSVRNKFPFSQDCKPGDQALKRTPEANCRATCSVETQTGSAFTLSYRRFGPSECRSRAGTPQRFHTRLQHIAQAVLRFKRWRLLRLWMGLV
jgi:hypothetical protein